MDASTRIILDYFEQINQIPRCSKNEQQVAAWLIAWAEKCGFDTRKDTAGNLVIIVPASEGFESIPTVVLQGHMDMVCEKRPDIQHDFKTDPIRHVISGDWLHATGTSLGADNGIALALMMALSTNVTVQHPKLELLFTVDEETGLTGANQLDEKILTGCLLINIDSEDEGIFTVGCAGGLNTSINLDLNPSSLEGYERLADISVSGLRGGHSGIDINKGRASAIKVLARILSKALSQLDLRLLSIDGGTTHNAIAREATARVALRTGQLDSLRKIVTDLETIVQAEYANIEKEISLNVTPLAETAAPLQGANQSDTRRMVDLLMALPHGVERMSADTPGLVDTSSNLATVSFSETKLHLLSSQRSVYTSRVEEISAQVAAIARLAGARVKTDNAYPAWEPKLDSTLLARCQQTYTTLFKKPPVVQIIHAGLECAVIGNKYPHMDMISVGPTMENPHSPDERLNIPSVSKLWQFLVALLRNISG